MAKFSAETLDIIFAVVLFLVGLGYAVSGFPARIVVACFIWVAAWAFFSHLFFALEGMDSCPVDVKIILLGAVTFLLVILLWGPVRSQYAKEHTRRAPSEPSQTTVVAQPIRSTPVAARSYLVFDGVPRYERVDASMRPLPDQDFQVGDRLFFNFFFKNIGPNAVEIYESDGWTYLESDSAVPTQKQLIADFKDRIKTRRGLFPQSTEGQTMSPGEPSRYSSAPATNDAGQPWRLPNPTWMRYERAKSSFLLPPR